MSVYMTVTDVLIFAAAVVVAGALGAVVGYWICHHKEDR